MCCWSQTGAVEEREDQKGEVEEGVGPCPFERAGLQGGEDSGRDNGHVQEEVGVAFHRRRRWPREGVEEDST